MSIWKKSLAAAFAALTLGAAPLAAHAERPLAAAHESQAPSARAARLPAAAGVQGSCNLNNADPTQLALLPGIGPVRAKAIVAHRQKQPFRSVEDIVKVKGIGRKTFARLRPYLSVNGPSTIHRVKDGSTP